MLIRNILSPFPRITFGYFFDHPFLVTSHALNKSQKVSMVISRISRHAISVRPLGSRIKIIGAHVRPYTLSYLTKRLINRLPWLIDTRDLFGETAISFGLKMDQCNCTEEMFHTMERVFLDNVLTRNLSTITQAIDIIERHFGDISLKELATGLLQAES